MRPPDKKAFSYEGAMKELHGLLGPWQNEPDRLEWRHAGFPCLIVRAPMGNLCGYVGVPPGHPWFGKDYGELADVEIHGGLTFSGPCEPGSRICHTPLAGEPEVFWQGFDCAHAFDLSPMLLRGLAPALRAQEARWTYRDIAYVKREVEGLAIQAGLVGISVEDSSK